MEFYDVFFVLSIAEGLLLAISMGGNDVANAMASAVGSKALTVRWALIIAAVMNIVGAFFLGGQVSATITSGIVNPEYIPDPKLLTIGMFSALLTAGVWVLLSTYFGLPVSSSTCAVGAVTGTGMSHGVRNVNFKMLGRIFMMWVVTVPIAAGTSALIFILLKTLIYE